MMSKSGQSAVEFVIMAGFLLTVFVFFASVNPDRTAQSNRLENDQIEETGLALKNKVDLANESSNRHIREFGVPEHICGSNHTIDIADNSVIVSSDDGQHQVSCSLKPVSGEINPCGVNVTGKTNGEVKLDEQKRAGLGS